MTARKIIYAVQNERLAGERARKQMNENENLNNENARVDNNKTEL